MEDSRNTLKILTSKPTGTTPLGRSRRTWEDNIRMDPKEIGIYMRNWADSVQDRDYWKAPASAVLNFGLHKPWSIVHLYCL